MAIVLLVHTSSSELHSWSIKWSLQFWRKWSQYLFQENLEWSTIIQWEWGQAWKSGHGCDIRFDKCVRHLINVRHLSHFINVLRHLITVCSDLKNSIIASPRLRPPSSCTLSLLQIQVFHLHSSSSPQHRSHGLCTLSFNPPPKNIPEYMFFGRLLFCAVIVLHANFVALLNIFIAFHKSQKQRHHKWLHLCNKSEKCS